MPAQGQDLKLFSAELFQSANPGWIVLLTPLIVAFFNWRASRRRPLSIPTKIAWGLIISGLSSVVMIIACYSTDIYHNKVGMSWLISSYGVFTISELLLSPVGLSLTSKVAPRRLTALMMGGWFLTTSIGAKISGILSSYWDDFDDKANYFWIGAIAAIIAGFAIMPLTKKLGKVVEDANASSE
jgi:POT family proton-dependent oligopeptide transporter